MGGYCPLGVLEPGWGSNFLSWGAWRWGEVGRISFVRVSSGICEAQSKIFCEILFLLATVLSEKIVLNKLAFSKFKYHVNFWG